jgi:hypothetical protein
MEPVEPWTRGIERRKKEEEKKVRRCASEDSRGVKRGAERKGRVSEDLNVRERLVADAKAKS